MFCGRTSLASTNFDDVGNSGRNARETGIKTTYPVVQHRTTHSSRTITPTRNLPLGIVVVAFSVVANAVIVTAATLSQLPLKKRHMRQLPNENLFTCYTTAAKSNRQASIYV
jgi:hypothetical protein